MRIPQGHTVRYAYVTLKEFAGFEHNGAVQWDVVKKYAGKYSESNGDQFADAPLVVWDEDGYFWVRDGRHRMQALIGAGYQTILVRWIAPTS